MVDDDERSRRVGAMLQCPLCDRCDVPSELVVVRTTATWDEVSMPRAHRVASGTWGRLRVNRGRLRFVAETSPVTDLIVDADRLQGIPPDVEHFVEPDGPVRFAVEFLSART